jgi:hypothetical protein
MAREDGGISALDPIEQQEDATSGIRFGRSPAWAWGD